MLIIKIQSLGVRGPQQHEKCILKPPIAVATVTNLTISHSK